MRIIVVEDDPDVAAPLKADLNREGYAVDLAPDGEEASRLAAIHSYDLAILDLNLPGMDGLETLRHLRASQPHLPVLVLTSRSSLDDRVLGLDLGADDYLTKPFHLREVSARIRSLLRRHELVKEPILRCGELALDPAARRAWLGRDPLRFTRKEFSLLEYLMRHHGEVISQERLLEHVWGNEAAPFTNVVRVHVNSLRRKLNDDPAIPRHIETVIGNGYRVVCPEES